MTRQRITSDSTFEQDMAYPRAVVDGDFVFVAGTVGLIDPRMKIEVTARKQK